MGSSDPGDAPSKIHTALTRLGGRFFFFFFFGIKSRGEQSEKKMERVGGEMTARYDHTSLSRYEILGKKDI